MTVSTDSTPMPARNVGPVTAALAAMHSADPDRIALRLIRHAITRQINADMARIDRCLAALDLMDGDPDLEAGQVQMIEAAGGLLTSATDCEDEGSESDWEDTRAELEESDQPLRMKGGGYGADAFGDIA